MDVKILKVVWQDHHSIAGWHDVADLKTEVLLNTSVGFLMAEDKLHITLAQTIVSDGEQCGDLINILTKNIVERKELT